MVSNTKVNINPSATTIERDSDLTTVPDGSQFFNSTTGRIEFTVDGGTSWLETASTADVTSIGLQEAYTNGDGTITLTSAKPVELIGINSGDPALFQMYTPDAAGLTRINFFGDNSVAAKISTSFIQSGFTDNTAGAEDGGFSITVPEGGVPLVYVLLDGTEGQVFLQRPSTVSETLTVVQGGQPTSTVSVYHDGAGLGDIGAIDFDKGTSKVNFASINSVAEDATPASEIGSLKFNVVESGAKTEYMSIDASIQRVQFNRRLRLINDDSFVLLENIDNSVASAASAIYISEFFGNDSNSDTVQYSEFKVTTPDVTALSHSGSVEISVAESGTTTSYLELDGVNQEVKALNSTSKTLDTVATLSDIGGTSTRQNIYDNGTADITLTAGKEIEFIGLNNTDNANINLYTPLNNGVCAVTMFANNNSASKTQTCEILSGMLDGTPGSEFSSFAVSTLESGNPELYMMFNGGDQDIKLFRDTEITGTLTSSVNIISTAGDITASSGNVTATSGILRSEGSGAPNPGELELYTSLNTGDMGQIQFKGDDSLSAEITYAHIISQILDDTTALTESNMLFAVNEDGITETFVELNGLDADIKLKRKVSVESDNIEFNGAVVSSSYLPCTTMRVVADGLIAAGAPVTPSTTTDFRVIQILDTDPDTTAVIGFAVNSAAIAGDVIEICAATIVTVQNAALTVVDQGDPIEKSDSITGRVQASAVSPGTFGSAAENAALNATFACWLTRNEGF
jgi:hypothetical protein